MGTNCVPSFADLFLYSNKSEFLETWYVAIGDLYTDDLIVFRKKKFGDDIKKIYSLRLTAEKAYKSDKMANYLDLTFIIDRDSEVSRKPFAKRDDFNLQILSIFHSFQLKYHQAPHMMFISRSSFDMHDVALLTVTWDIVIIFFWWAPLPWLQN